MRAKAHICVLKGNVKNTLVLFLLQANLRERTTTASLVKACEEERSSEGWSAVSVGEQSTVPPFDVDKVRKVKKLKCIK